MTSRMSYANAPDVPLRTLLMRQLDKSSHRAPDTLSTYDDNQATHSMQGILYVWTVIADLIAASLNGQPAIHRAVVKIAFSSRSVETWVEKGLR